MRIFLRRLALTLAAILLVTFSLQQAALAQDEVPIVFPKPAPVLEIEPPNVPIVPTPPTPSVPLESAAEETEQGAPSEPTGEETPQEESAEPAEAVPEPEGQAALAAEGEAAQYQIPVLSSKQAYGASNGSFTYSVDLDLPPFHGIEPQLALRYSSNVGLRAGGKSQGWLGVGWILDGLDIIERVSARQGTPRYDGTDIFLWNGEPLVSCAALQRSATCADYEAGVVSYFSRVESYYRFRYYSGNRNWTITRPDGVVFQLAPVEWFSGPGNPEELRTAYRWLVTWIRDTHNNIVSFDYDCAAPPQCELNSITYTGTRVQFYWEARPDFVSYGNGLLGNPVNGISKATKRLKTIAIRHGVTSGLEPLQKAFALIYEQSSVSKLSRLKEIIPYGSDAVLNAGGTVTPGSALPRHRFEYSQASIVLQLGPTLPNPYNPQDPQSNDPDPAVADVDGDGKDDVIVRTPCRPPVTYPNPLQAVRYAELDASTNPPTMALKFAFSVFCPLIEDPWVLYSRQKLLGHFNSDKYLDFLFVEIQRNTVTNNYKTFFSGALSDVNLANIWQPFWPGQPAFVMPAGLNGPLLYRVQPRVPSPGHPEFWGTEYVVGGQPNAEPLLYSYDFDGDAIADLVKQDDDDEVWRVHFSGGAPPVDAPFENETLFADLNGDGLTDATRVDGAQLRPYLSTGSDFHDRATGFVVQRLGLRNGRPQWRWACRAHAGRARGRRLGVRSFAATLNAEGQSLVDPLPVDQPPPWAWPPNATDPWKTFSRGFKNRPFEPPAVTPFGGWVGDFNGDGMTDPIMGLSGILCVRP